MTPAFVFSICNTIVLPQWLLMIVAPKWKWTKELVKWRIIPFILAIVYAIYIIPAFAGGIEGGFDSLENVMKLFQSEEAVLGGWIHYLAFDLLVGSWIFQNAPKKGIPHALVVICLIGCFMLGPVGFLIYWAWSKFKE